MTKTALKIVRSTGQAVVAQASGCGCPNWEDAPWVLSAEVDRRWEAHVAREVLLFGQVVELLGEQHASTRFEASRVQNEVLALRLRTERMPTRLYCLYQASDEQDIIRAVDDVRRKLLRVKD
jgi:hypothetical protein